jgi:hypothetical protein
MVRKYKDGGIVESLFGNTQNWFNNLILSMFGSGGNPSAALNATAEDMIKTGAKNTIQGYKDFVFDPTDPVDYGLAALPGLKPAKAVAKKASETFKFPLVLQTPKKGLKITPTHLLDEAEGATPGAYRTINGLEYYVKRPETSLETTGELIGSTLWARLGLGGPKLQMINKTTLASKIIPNLIPSSPGYLRQYIGQAPNKIEGANNLAKALRQYINEALPTNALLGNSDTHGMNILFNKDTKKFENIDLGITALTAIGEEPAEYLFKQELTRRTRYLVEAMKDSGFNLRQTNDVLKNNGLSEISAESFKYSRSFNFSDNLTNRKSLTPQINKISSMLGFDLKKDISDPANVSAINARSNPFIKDIVKNNPELATWLNLNSNPKNLDSGMSGGLRELFGRLQEASKNPVMKYANGGLVGYNEGGPVKPKPRDPGGWDAQGNWHPTSYFKKPKETRRRLVIDSNTINMAATDPAAPWNKGGWAENSKDPEKRKNTWQMYGWKPSYIKEGEATSADIMNVAKTMAYFTPVIGAGTLIGDSASSFSKGDVAGGIFNAAGAALGGVGPKLFEKIGGFKPAQDFFNTLMKPVAAVAKPIIKVATPAAQAASNAAMRTAFRLGTVGIEQGSRSAATYVPSFMKSSMGALNTNNLDATQFVQPPKPKPEVDVAATALMRSLFGENHPEVLATKLPAVSRRKPAAVPKPKPNFLQILNQLAKEKLGNINPPKSVKKTVRDVSTLIAAKRFEMQTKNIPPILNPGKGTAPSLNAAEKMVEKMRLGKDMVLDIQTAKTDNEIAEMYDMESPYDVPDELLAGLRGSFRNPNAPGLKSMGGNVSGTIWNRDGLVTAEDIFIRLEDAYKGKGIAQRFTTQYMKL